MRLLLDHCVHGKTKRLLAAAGHAVVSLKDIGKAEARNSEVIELARSRACILVTEDSDFTNVGLYPLGSHLGIIYIVKAPGGNWESTHAALLDLLSKRSQDDVCGGLCVVDSGSSTITKPPSAGSLSD